MSLPLRVSHLRSSSFLLSALLASAGGLFAPIATMAAEPATVSSAAAHPQQFRIATFNMAMGLKAGELAQRLSHNNDPQLKKVAAIIQTVKPDILLLNEFDSEPGSTDLYQRIALFQQNYLNQDQFGQKSLNFDFAFTSDVNTGLDSKADLNSDGKLGTPADAHGFGLFHGQYSMVVLSRFPINRSQARSWQRLRWIDYPDAELPQKPDGSSWYSEAAQSVMRLSSKSHWDVPIEMGGHTLHFLTAHPTPPVFDGPEDRNGLRNRDEIGLLASIIDPARNSAIKDDRGQNGGLNGGDLFVIAGDMNADPFDGDSASHAIDQLLSHSLINAEVIPTSTGAQHAATSQGGNNQQHQGNPAADTADFDDTRGPGNLRIDYVLPSRTLQVLDSGVYWPAPGQTGADWIEVSDHRLVWLDIQWPASKAEQPPQ